MRRGQKIRLRARRGRLGALELHAPRYSAATRAAKFPSGSGGLICESGGPNWMMRFGARGKREGIRKKKQRRGDDK